MTGPSLSSADLDQRRRRLLYRSWHRGTREMDLIIGRFADQAIVAMTTRDLDDFERLIEVPDRDLFAWVSGTQAAPDNYTTPIFSALKRFHDEGRGAWTG